MKGKKAVEVMTWFADWVEDQKMMSELEKRTEQHKRAEMLDMVLVIVMGASLFSAFCAACMVAGEDYITGIIVFALSIAAYGLTGLLRNWIFKER